MQKRLKPTLPEDIAAVFGAIRAELSAVLGEQLLLCEQPDNASPRNLYHGAPSAEREVEKRSL